MFYFYYFLFSTNNVQLATNQVSQSNQIQLQLDALKAMPYGDSPLFKRFYKVPTIKIKVILLFIYGTIFFFFNRMCLK
jgi:hypothetical protein